MADEWTDWIAHDGAGRPPGLKGRIPLVVEADVPHRRFGRVVWNTKVIEEFAENIPDWPWDWTMAGKPSPTCSCGNHLVARINRYKLRRSPEVEKLKDLIRDLPLDGRDPEAPSRVRELEDA